MSKIDPAAYGATSIVPQRVRTFAPRLLVAAVFATMAAQVQADTVTDWNAKSGELIAEAKLGTPPAVRLMAFVQTAAYEAALAANASDATPKPSVDAAIAAAHRVVLLKLLPAQAAAIEATYQKSLAAIEDGPAGAAGVQAGERAAEATIARRAADLAAIAEAYRPHTSAGAYVPTVTPAVPTWPQRKPWLMTDAAQFRPGPPPALHSAAWARDFNEVKTLGAKASTARTAEQTEIARFWEFSLPSVYHGVVRSVAEQPGRDVAENARLFATVAQAMDDALISVLDAKYHYNFWRPTTAIRNADIDGHDATQRDASWSSFIDAPMHPEYPSAHTILAAAVGTVLKAELAGGPTPVLKTTSPTAKAGARQWTDVDAFVSEVANARIYEGIHYRTSTEVGAAMGRQIGALAVAQHMPTRTANAETVSRP